LTALAGKIIIPLFLLTFTLKRKERPKVDDHRNHMKKTREKRQRIISEKGESHFMKRTRNDYKTSLLFSFQVVGVLVSRKEKGESHPPHVISAT